MVIDGGMDTVVDRLYKGYGEMLPLDNPSGVDPDRLAEEGIAYAKKEFPKVGGWMGVGG